MAEHIDPTFWDHGDFVYWCLADRPRTSAFRDSIRSVVRPGDVVVDLGSGTGVLGLTAAQCGAGKVYLVELDPIQARFLRESVRRGSYGDRVEVVEDDALRVAFDQPADVVICEMIGTALITEFQGSATNHILQYCHDQTRFVPGAYRCVAELVFKPPAEPDLDLYVISYDYCGDHPHDTDSTPLTAPVTYRSFDFSKPVDLGVDETFELVAERPGSINGLRLRGVTDLPGVGEFGSTASYSMPIIFPIPPQEVRRGDVFRVHLKYQVGGGVPGVHYDILQGAHAH